MLSGMGSLRSLRTEPPSPVGSGTTTQEVLPASLRRRQGALAKPMQPLGGLLLPLWRVFRLNTVVASRACERLPILKLKQSPQSHLEMTS